MEIFQISLGIAIVLVILELITTTFIFLGFAAGFLVVGIVQFITGNLNLSRDVLVCAVVSTFAIFTFRSIFKKRTDQKKLIGDDINLY